MESVKYGYHHCALSNAVVLIVILLCVASGVRAQAVPSWTPPGPAPSPTPQAQPSPSLEKEFFKNILRDQRALVLSPFHITRGDTEFLLPLGAATAALIATDRSTAGELIENGGSQTRLRISKDISYLGTGYTTGGVAAAFYLVGRATHDARARETGLLAGEALVDSGIDVTVLKTITKRPRPTQDGGRGEFFDEGSGNSFHSGETLRVNRRAPVHGKDRRL
jgi:hypothetical protein